MFISQVKITKREIFIVHIHVTTFNTDFVVDWFWTLKYQVFLYVCERFCPIYHVEKLSPVIF